tara:strand:- start:367 stop:720 length:354 start_codon:yes stop_codon:yes gene_type:complete
MMNGSNIMFDDLFSFNKERLPLQALGLYIVLFIIGVALGGIGGLLFASDFESGLLAGHIISVIYCLFLAYQILSEKNQLNSAFSAFLFIAGFMAYLIGALGGLIPIAYLSTIKNLKS